MITASHNPKQDNGYKAYAGNGCQIISPADKEITKCIENQNLCLWNLQSINYENPIETLREGYFLHVKSLFRIHGEYPRVVYTPMHGVGFEMVNMVLSKPFPILKKDQER
jgi:phosphomannomutase